jgi:hypothetical protein
VPDRWDTAVDPGVSERILRRCRAVEPRLRDAQIIEVVTGLRPDRHTVRLETETSRPRGTSTTTATAAMASACHGAAREKQPIWRPADR